ncbi:MAG: lipid-A-disaccharide synthase [Tannerellaceae bacterium]|jgi:lipid-A-disaccharide synthase|nr:lipid-A-disaccharide synthase [Tannerellaceae bacterium]
MKYYLIAGEASGDLHASNLMKSINDEDHEADFRFMGGNLMQAVGGVLAGHYRKMAFMGIIPVLFNIRTIVRNMNACKKDIRLYNPDVVILIDYPGFNLKVAKFVKSILGIPICYYISPKIWAWKQYRIKSIRRYVDQMLCILPFEKNFYSSLNYPVEYVGNPSVDAVANFRAVEADAENVFLKEIIANRPVLAILAGSRRQEIRDNLPVMLEISALYPDFQAVIAGAPGIEPSFYDAYINGYDAKIVFDKTYLLLHCSAVALVTSGTATLETALFRVPQIVCYYTPLSRLSGFIFRRFFSAPYISLVNLIAKREIVKELFAELFTKENICREMDKILNDVDYRNAMLAGYDEVIKILGAPGASKRAAHLIVQRLIRGNNKK